MPSRPDVFVIGAGVVGLTCAVGLAESGANVAVVAERVPGSTSLAAGALWGPYLVEPKAQVRTWALRSFAVFQALSQDPTTGVKMTSGIEASRTPGPPPDFTDMVPDLTTLSSGQLPAGFEVGVSYTAPLIDMPAYLDVLLERLHAAGGRLETGRIDTLTEAADLGSHVVNATGLGARTLVPDPALYSIRGQLVVAENPGISEWFSEDTGESPDLTHWYPHGNTLVLGGQALTDDWSDQPDPTVARAIIERCAAIEPALSNVRVLGHRVGFRPTRPLIRLEPERVEKSLIVHCYGHGGAGATLSWGCAEHVRDLILA
jgi:D-amino-acid oxidase